MVTKHNNSISCTSKEAFKTGHKLAIHVFYYNYDLNYYSCKLEQHFITGDTCVDPKVKSSVYTTTEATSSLDTIFIVQFSLTCKNGLKVKKSFSLL